MENALEQAKWVAYEVTKGHTRWAWRIALLASFLVGTCV
jgi:hypothetical protein